MRTIVKIFITSAVALSTLAGCDVKDPIYEIDHPEQAQIKVTADWSAMGAGITKPAQYTAAYGSEKLTATQDTYTFPNLLDPGSYTVYLYNNVPEVPVSVSGGGATAAVNTVTAPGGASGTFVEPLPGWLFTGRLAATVEKDTDHEFTVPMKQQVRQLTLVIEPTGGTADQIESITASLSGVAGSLDIDGDTHGTPSNVALTFTKATDGKWKATVRLLGVTGAEQKLTGTITFTGGNSGDMPLESDLSSDLSGFNGDKKTPLDLGGTLAETPAGAGFTATIEGWNKLPGGTGIAN